MQKEVLTVLGLFSRKQDLDMELLPPPPPFPDIEPTKPIGKSTQKKEKKETTKIVLKQREGVKDILAQATQYETSEPEDFLSMRAPNEVISVDDMLQDGEEITGAITEAKKPESLLSLIK